MVCVLAGRATHPASATQVSGCGVGSWLRLLACPPRVFGIQLRVALRHPLQCLLRVDPGRIGPIVFEAGHTSASVSTRLCLRHQ